ncbi:type II toxin-antitoxin system VapC family toxin [Prosthecobacter sp.]|uniref:type II toxin-antitoxin system VapC family toxin n=1 Tax=Prosthecobacter sp. TaxID=1965333 RepID=UPI003784831F
MFVILDTNHYRELVHETPLGDRLRQRLIDADADAFTTVITAQEIYQGWAAEINRKSAGSNQVHAYKQFLLALRAFERITILPFDEDAAVEFHRLQSFRLRAGTMDLKIAAIAVSHTALLLSRNLTDFQNIPALRLENWLD